MSTTTVRLGDNFYDLDITFKLTDEHRDSYIQFNEVGNTIFNSLDLNGCMLGITIKLLNDPKEEE